MTYSDRVNDAFLHQSSFSRQIPDEAVSYALSLRESPISQVLFETVQDELELDDLSALDQRLFRTRVLGGLTTKLVLGSYADKAGQAFMELSDSDRESVIHETANSYARNATRFMDATDGTPDNLLQPHHSIDPVGAVPHSFIRSELYRVKRSKLSVSDRLRMLYHYANFLPGSFDVKSLPDISVGSNDSILVQAFGRNSVPDSGLEQIGDIHSVFRSDIVTMQYLDNIKFDSGESNRELADVVSARLIGKRAIEPILQWEVAHALWQKDSNKYVDYQNYIHTVWPSSNFYPTHQVKADSIKVMDRLGLYNPLELAHPDMLIRALGILARQGVHADAIFADIPFDPNSIQAQTRGKLPWVVREFLTRGEHALRGRVKY